MNVTTKAKIDLRTGVIELEGSEEFVSKYLDEFKRHFEGAPILRETDKEKSTAKAGTRKKPHQPTPSGEHKKVGPKKIEVEEFEIKGNSKAKIPSLKDFLEEKKAIESSPKTILAVGYYVTQMLKKEEFSEGNIEFAYRALGLTGRPAHLHQTIINKKNKAVWFETGSDSTHWKVGRVGQLYVEEKMPEKEE